MKQRTIITIGSTHLLIPESFDAQLLGALITLQELDYDYNLKTYTIHDNVVEIKRVDITFIRENEDEATPELLKRAIKAREEADTRFSKYYNENQALQKRIQELETKTV
jgi:hypothetical protein